MSFTNTSIETVSGRIVDVANPKPDDFTITDIAWALSREPRFSGHTIHILPYTVGQHSVVVGQLIVNALSGHEPLASRILKYFEDEVFICDFIKYLDAKQIRKIALLGLLHDASEAYLRDIPSPVKNLPGLKEAYLAAETALMKEILIQFDVKFPDLIWNYAWKIVHWADLYARTIEAYHLMPSRGLTWPLGAKFELSLSDLQKFDNPKPSTEVYEEFLMWYGVYSDK